MKTLLGTNFLIHDTPDTLPIFSFYQIIKEQDLRYLIEGFFGGDIDLKLEHQEELSETFEKILKEYNAICATDKEFKNLKKEVHIASMEAEYKIITGVLHLYSKSPEIIILKLLDEVGCGFDFDKPIGPQIDKLSKSMIGLKMRIKIAKSNFVASNKQKENKINDFDIETECLYLEQNLDLGYQLDPKKVTCTRFAKLKKVQKEKQEHYEKQLKTING